MTVRTFIVGTLLAFGMSIAVFALVLNWVDPTAQNGGLGYVLFFLALFLVVSSLASLLGYAARSLFVRSQLPAYRMRPSLRQGIVLGIFVDILLFLQLQRILVWWVTAIIIMLGIVIELVFMSYDRNGTHARDTREQRA
jgi:hypothetical protein